MMKISLMETIFVNEQERKIYNNKFISFRKNIKPWLSCDVALKVFIVCAEYGFGYTPKPKIISKMNHTFHRLVMNIYRLITEQFTVTQAASWAILLLVDEMYCSEALLQLKFKSIDKSMNVWGEMGKYPFSIYTGLVSNIVAASRILNIKYKNGCSKLMFQNL